MLLHQELKKEQSMVKKQVKLTTFIESEVY